MRAPRWIPLLKLLDLDEELQNEIPASPQPCQAGPVGWIAPSCLVQLPASFPRLYFAELWLLPQLHKLLCNFQQAISNDSYNYWLFLMILNHYFVQNTKISRKESLLRRWNKTMFIIFAFFPQLFSPFQLHLCSQLHPFHTVSSITATATCSSSCYQLEVVLLLRLHPQLHHCFIVRFPQ